MNAVRALSFVRDAVRARRRERVRPRFLTFTVTFACNARCVMCDSWRKPADDDLRLDEIERIFAELPRLDAVRLTGGEPFVRKDLLGIASAARRSLRPLELHVTTNGFLTDRIVEFCERRPRDLPLQLLVSIDAPGAEHDRIRGRRGSFDDAMRTLEALAPRARELGMQLAVNQTVLDATGLASHRALRDVLRPLGVRHQVVVGYAESATYGSEPEADVAPSASGEHRTFGVFARDELRVLLDALDSDVPRLPWRERIAKRYYLRGLRRRLLDGVGDPNPACVALSAHVRLFPNGDVPTCQFNGRVVGNLRTTSFRAIWDGELSRRQRAWVDACPGCWAECEIVPSALYTGDLARALVRPRQGGDRTRRPVSARGRVAPAR